MESQHLVFIKGRDDFQGSVWPDCASKHDISLIPRGWLSTGWVEKPVSDVILSLLLERVSVMSIVTHEHFVRPLSLSRCRSPYTVSSGWIAGTGSRGLASLSFGSPRGEGGIHHRHDRRVELAISGGASGNLSCMGRSGTFPWHSCDRPRRCECAV